MPWGIGSKCAGPDDCPLEICVTLKAPLGEDADGGGCGMRSCAGVCGPGPTEGREIPWTRTPGSCTAIAVTSGAIFLGRYAMLNQSIAGAGLPPAPRKTAFHCTKRAAGQSSLSPEGFAYGPAQSLQLESGSEVFPERAYIAIRGAPALFAEAIFSPHQTVRP